MRGARCGPRRGRAVGGRRRKQRAWERARTWGPSTHHILVARLKHEVHVSDSGRLEAQRLVELRRLLPRRTKEGH
jgi:hypothetical protein